MATTLDPVISSDIFGMSRIPGVRPPAPAPAAPTGPGAEFDVRAEQARQRMQPVQQQIAQTQQEKQRLGQESEQFKAQQAAKEAAGMAGAERGFLQQIEQAPMRPLLEEKVQQEKDYFFRPSQEDGMMMAGLASLITVLGTSLGKGGKNYATAALAGMNGMMEGYQKGRDDIFRQERQLFESNAKALKDQITTIRTALQDYEKKAVTDRQRALAELKEKLTKEGADFLAARAERQGVVNMLPELLKQEKQLQAQIDRYDTKAADARARSEADKLRSQLRLKEMADRERMIRERQLGIESRREERGAAPGKEKPPRQMSDAQVVKVEGLESVATGLEKLKKDFKPEYAGLGLLGFGAELEVEARRRLGDKVGSEAARWWANYNRLQAPNRHALFGATLTGNELKNYQSFTAKPSDSADYIQGSLDDQIAYSRDLKETRLRTFEGAGYKVPEKKPRSYDTTFGGTAAPAQGAAPAAPATPATGWSSADEQRLRELEEKARGAVPQ